MLLVTKGPLKQTLSFNAAHLGLSAIDSLLIGRSIKALPAIRERVRRLQHTDIQVQFNAARRPYCIDCYYADSGVQVNVHNNRIRHGPAATSTTLELNRHP